MSTFQQQEVGGEETAAASSEKKGKKGGAKGIDFLAEFDAEALADALKAPVPTAAQAKKFAAAALPKSVRQTARRLRMMRSAKCWRKRARRRS